MQVQIPKAEHMFLMGPRGQNLKDIYDITGMIEYQVNCYIYNITGTVKSFLFVGALILWVKQVWI